MQKFAPFLALGLSLAQTAGAQVDTSIVRTGGRTTWAPGLRSPVPVRPLCNHSAVAVAAAYAGSPSDASAAIRAAIVACPAETTIKLPAGTFNVNNHILIHKAVTLKGEGPDQTKLVKTNGAQLDTYMVGDPQPLIIIGPSRWPYADDRTSVNLSQTVRAGSKAVTVDNATGFAPGQFVLLDEDDFNTASWLPLPGRVNSSVTSSIWASDRLVFNRHNPPEPWDGPFPASLTWFGRPGRPLNEIKEIVAVSGRKITFSTPVHIDYTRQKRAQLTRYSHAHVRGAGVEDLSVSGGGEGNIRFAAAAYSWVKNIENVFWAGEGVAVSRSFRVEIRDSFIHDTVWPAPGGAGYALSLSDGSSEVLIENNSVMNVNKVIVVRSCGAGSVVGYNYMDNGFILYDYNWVEVGLNASHMVGSHHVLFEGNESWNYDSDNTHGNAIAMTVFRNHLVGRRGSIPGTSNVRGIGLMFGSWWHSFIGNVIGEAGQMNGWFEEDPGDGTFGAGWRAFGEQSFIWKLGYDPGHWDQFADPKVQQTVYRNGNFDYLTNRVQWDRQARRLPASLYLTSKPAFFGSNPWPWVDPVGGTKLGVLPAKQRTGLRPPMYYPVP